MRGGGRRSPGVATKQDFFPAFRGEDEAGATRLTLWVSRKR